MSTASVPTRRRPSAVVRARRLLRERGLRATLGRGLERLVGFDVLVLVRRELAAPLPPDPADLADGFEFREARPDDIEVWREEWPEKVSWYVERLSHPNEFCYLGLHEGKLVTHCWFALGAYRDPIGYTFDAGEGGAYQGEGWVSPSWRGHGVATRFINDLYRRLLPQRGIRHVLAYYHHDALPSKRLHERFEFEPIGKVYQLRIGRRRFHWTRRR